MPTHVTRRAALKTAAAVSAGAAIAQAGTAVAQEANKPAEAGSNAPRKVAFIGTAHIHTPNFIRIIKSRQDIQTKYVWDHDAARAKENAGLLSAKAAGERKEILADPEIAAVVVCSETNRHEELVLEIAAAKKHLFVEKPIGLGAKDANAIADAVEKAGVIFQTGYAMRGDPAHLFLREQIQKGVFGTITRVRKSVCHSGSLGGWFDKEWRWMADPKQAGVGGFGDLGTHGLDILMWFLGDVARVTASIHAVTHRYGDCDEFGEGILEFKNGAVATLAAGWLDLQNPLDILISGTGGCAYVMNGKVFFQCDKVDGADGKQLWTKLPPKAPHAFELFLDAVCGKKDAALVGVREAAARCSVMEAMYRAAESHKWVEI
ncbi:MAG: Gfo/Idh/MocA family oxidoreductase [Candidatus Sumerlaeota bacterium]|nr:Gfo/Idh/MocA family oxidoreductase [Candidatus Sumerlaeota bacterium]